MPSVHLFKRAPTEKQLLLEALRHELVEPFLGDSCEKVSLQALAEGKTQAIPPGALEQQSAMALTSLAVALNAMTTEVAQARLAAERVADAVEDIAVSLGQ